MKSDKGLPLINWKEGVIMNVPKKEMGLKRLVESIYVLTAEEQYLLLGLLFTCFDEEQKQRWSNRTLYLAYPGSRWHKVERWMEGQYRKDMARAPRSVASMSIAYFKINSKMLPFLIKTAQKVKNKLWMRQKRQSERLENDIGD
ncbi:MAG: hypothetical protein ACE5GF_02100 [Thermodesulfobacteriota bacterium]